MAIRATALGTATAEEKAFFSEHCADIGFMPQVHEEMDSFTEKRQRKEATRLEAAAKAAHKALKARQPKHRTLPALKVNRDTPLASRGTSRPGGVDAPHAPKYDFIGAAQGQDFPDKENTEQRPRNVEHNLPWTSSAEKVLARKPPPFYMNGAESSQVRTPNGRPPRPPFFAKTA